MRIQDRPTPVELTLADLQARFEVDAPTWHVYRTRANRLIVRDRELNANECKGNDLKLLGRCRGGRQGDVMRAARKQFKSTLEVLTPTGQ
jgi:hypothetical protein